MEKQSFKQKNRKKRALSWDEELVYFVAKTVGGVTLFFIIALGADMYYFWNE